MTKLIPILLLSLLTLPAFGETDEPIGLGAGAGFFDGDLGVHVRKGFYFGEVDEMGIILQAGLYEQRKWTGRFDVDFHYVLTPDKPVRIYPLAGIDFAVQNRNNRFGANIGGGLDLDARGPLLIFMEAKYVLGDWDGFAFTAGFYF